MSNRTEVLVWQEGTEAFLQGNIQEALNIWINIADTARLHYNLAICFMVDLAFEDAIGALTRAIACDKFFAAAYFQRASCYYQTEKYDEAFEDLNACLKHMRGNSVIDYTQLGLNMKLWQSLVYFNRGLTYLVTGSEQEGLNDLSMAKKSIPIDMKDSKGNDIEPRDMSFIDEALLHGLEAPFKVPVYQIPDTLIFKPPKQKVENTNKIDYLGKSKLVATANQDDTFSGFSGTEINLKRKESISSVAANSISNEKTTIRPKSNEPAASAVLTLSRGETTKKLSNPASLNEQKDFAQRQPVLADQLNSKLVLGSKKLRIKCHYSDIRIVQVDLDATLPQILKRIEAKYQLQLEPQQSLKLYYKDEDQQPILIADQDDFVIALESKGIAWAKEAGKIEVWVEL